MTLFGFLSLRFVVSYFELPNAAALDVPAG